MRSSGLIAVGVWAALAGNGLAQVEAEVAEAGKTFQARCLACHQPPDLQFATDRAWLDQVNRTA
jgi:hypothetical protein